MLSEASLPFNSRNAHVCVRTQPCMSFWFYTPPIRGNQSTKYHKYWHISIHQTQMKKKYGKSWQKLLGTHIHFTIYKKQCYVSWEGKTQSVALIHVPLEACCHAFNRYQRVRSALFSEMESQIKRPTNRKVFREKRSSARLQGVLYWKFVSNHRHWKS